MKSRFVIAGTLLLLLASLLSGCSSAATIAAPKKPHSKSKHITESASTQKKMARSKHSTKSAAASQSKPTTTTASTKSKGKKKSKYYERFYASSFAADQTDGDITTGEDPVVRAAAVEALGNMNGTVVSIDPESGRILAMVNQRLALSAGAQPCSTIKVAVALAALSENVVTKDTQVPLGKYWLMDLTGALAH